MKTNVVQQAKSERVKVVKVFQVFKTFLVPSFCLTFRHFLTCHCTRISVTGFLISIRLTSVTQCGGIRYFFYLSVDSKWLILLLFAVKWSRIDFFQMISESFICTIISLSQILGYVCVCACEGGSKMRLQLVWNSSTNP